MTMEEEMAVREYLESLEICTKNKSIDKILGVLESLKLVLEKNFHSRKYAAQNGAYGLILKVLTSFKDEGRVVRSGLKPMIRLTSCQPNLLDEEGIRCQIDLLKSKLGLSNTQLLLRWVKQACIKCEMNRRDIFNAGVINELKNIFEDEFIPGSKARDVCSLLRALTLDDDPGFDYGNSVGRTCDIANDILNPMTILLRRFKHEKKVANEILQTLSVLLVRNEYCKKFKEAGGIASILEVMASYPDDENLNCIILRLMKIVSENDDVKVHLVTQGAAPLVVSAMSRIQTGAISVAGLSCMAALTLRSPRNSGIFYDCEAPGLIIETMKRYPGCIKVQRYGTRAVSNMTIVNKIESRAFEACGVDTVLETAMKLHWDLMDGDVKTAFRNLGMNPELKDHWIKIK